MSKVSFEVGAMVEPPNRMNELWPEVDDGRLWGRAMSLNDLGTWDNHNEPDLGWLSGPLIRVAGTAIHLSAVKVTVECDGSMEVIAENAIMWQKILSALEDSIDSAHETVEYDGARWVIIPEPTPASSMPNVPAILTVWGHPNAYTLRFPDGRIVHGDMGEEKRAAEKAAQDDIARGIAMAVFIEANADVGYPSPGQEFIESARSNETLRFDT